MGNFNFKSQSIPESVPADDDGNGKGSDDAPVASNSKLQKISKHPNLNSICRGPLRNNNCSSSGACGGVGGGDGEEKTGFGFATYPIASKPLPSRQSKTLHFFKGSDVEDVEEIGVGFFGKTFKGNVQGRGNEKKRVNVAVKMFQASLSMNKCYGQLFKLMEMKHRNVVSLIGVIVDETNDCLIGPEGPRLVLQYFPEGSLVNYLSKKENPKDFAMLGKLALDIISGCMYLHDHNVIHGTLAARNVLIQRSARKHQTHFNAKVSDYGICKLELDLDVLADEAKESNKNDPSISAIEPIRWMPKELVEQISAELPLNFTKAADVWSFGVVLWEMWTKGALPFGSFSQEEIKKFVVQEGKSPLSIHRPHGCPKQIVSVMETIFKVGPADRPTFKMLFDCFAAFRVGENRDKGRRGGRKEIYSCQGQGRRQRQKENSGSSQFSSSSSSKLPSLLKDTQNSKAPYQHQQGLSSSSSSLNQNRAPPPYSALPLPSHSSHIMQAPVPASSLTGPLLETEIQRRERELQQLKTKHLQEEFTRKQMEMDEIMRKMAENTGGGGTSSSNREGILPLMPSCSYPSRDRDRGRSRRRRGGRGRGGSGRSRDRDMAMAGKDSGAR